MSEIDGTRTICIPSLAFNYVNNRLESIGCQGELYARERGTHVAHYGTRYHELFGTPERAVRIVVDMCNLADTCSGCPFRSRTPDGVCGDYYATLEWLRGDAE